MKTELDTREQATARAARRAPGGPATEIPPAPRRRPSRAASPSHPHPHPHPHEHPHSRPAGREAQAGEPTGFQPARPGGRRLRVAPTEPAAPASSKAGTATLAPPRSRPATARPAPAPPRTTAAPPRTTPAREAAARKLAGVPRTPFVLLVLGLLGGGLVCLLVINSTLATASYRITDLQQSNTQLAQQEQELQQQIATEKDLGSVAHRAYQLGMRPQAHLTFLNTKTGRVYTQPRSLANVPNIPGYTP